MAYGRELMPFIGKRPGRWWWSWFFEVIECTRNPTEKCGDRNFVFNSASVETLNREALTRTWLVLMRCVLRTRSAGSKRIPCEKSTERTCRIGRDRYEIDIYPRTITFAEHCLFPEDTIPWKVQWHSVGRMAVFEKRVLASYLIGFPAKFVDRSTDWIKQTIRPRGLPRGLPHVLNAHRGAWIHVCTTRVRWRSREECRKKRNEKLRITFRGSLDRTRSILGAWIKNVLRVTILNDCTNLSGREGYLHFRTIVSRVRSTRRVVRYSGGVRTDLHAAR